MTDEEYEIMKIIELNSPHLTHQELSELITDSYKHQCALQTVESKRWIGLSGFNIGISERGKEALALHEKFLKRK